MSIMEEIQLKEKIENFIKSGEEELQLDMIPVDKYKKILNELGFEEGDWNTNGWECDFYQKFNHPEYGEYTFGGSLYYGGWSLYNNMND